MSQSSLDCGAHRFTTQHSRQCASCCLVFRSIEEKRETKKNTSKNYYLINDVIKLYEYFRMR